MLPTCGTGADRDALYQCKFNAQNKAQWAKEDCSKKEPVGDWVCTICGLKPMNANAKQAAACMRRSVVEEYGKMADMIGCEL